MIDDAVKERNQEGKVLGGGLSGHRSTASEAGDEVVVMKVETD
jgi:hypothetical protein